MRQQAKERRAHWVAELEKLSGSFEDDSAKMMSELGDDVSRHGIDALLDHLRVCGAMPEKYGHDSSAEKLYSKYTDVVISQAFIAIGLNSHVITARADTADVQARAKNYSLVADAKAFRLSRTAKNQKDFKVQAMDGWRNGLDYAVVVCPIYQLPSTASQIYHQAISRNVCILSYSHLAALLSLSAKATAKRSEVGLEVILKAVSLLHPGKNAGNYWTGINKAMLDVLRKESQIWTLEKKASLEALQVVKEESIVYLRQERDRIMRLSQKQAIAELIRSKGFDSRIAQIERLNHGNLLGI
jgi:HindIII restriction endonuclease